MDDKSRVSRSAVDNLPACDKKAIAAALMRISADTVFRKSGTDSAGQEFAVKSFLNGVAAGTIAAGKKTEEF
jgi:hypothetical protein